MQFSVKLTAPQGNWSNSRLWCRWPCSPHCRRLRMNGSEGTQESKPQQVLVTQGCTSEARKGRGTHAGTCATASPDFYRKDVSGKLDSETIRHADLSLKRRFSRTEEPSAFFYCLDNVSTGSIPHITLWLKIKAFQLCFTPCEYNSL